MEWPSTTRDGCRLPVSTCPRDLLGDEVGSSSDQRNFAHTIRTVLPSRSHCRCESKAARRNAWIRRRNNDGGFVLVAACPSHSDFRTRFAADVVTSHHCIAFRSGLPVVDRLAAASNAAHAADREVQRPRNITDSGHSFGLDNHDSQYPATNAVNILNEMF